MSDIVPAAKQSWDQLPDETDVQYVAFTQYCKMGQWRDLKKLGTRIDIPPAKLAKISDEHDWPARAREYDRACQGATPDDRDMSPMETLAFQFAAGHAMMELGISAIALKNPSQIKTSDALKLVKEGADLKRSAIGVNDGGVQINVSIESVDRMNEMIEYLDAAVVVDGEDQR